MANDDYGLGIPVPDGTTEDYELKPLLRDALNTIARLLTERPTLAAPTLEALAHRLDQITPADPPPAPAPAPDYSAALASLRREVKDIRDATPAPAPDYSAAIESLSDALNDMRLELARRDYAQKEN